MENVASQMQAKACRIVLDAPCGEGRNLFFLAKKLPFVVGMDVSTSALSRLRGLVEVNELKNCLLAHGDVFDIPFEDEQFDAVLCWDLLGHLKNAQQAIRKLLRVCRKGGLLVGSVFAIGDSTRGVDMSLVGDEEYLYGVDCYFKFHSDSSVRELLESSQAILSQLDLAVWTEEPHPGYREYKHEHQSWCFTLIKS
jgi:ubiquinone/menaquinone biosynthesis C-methylase UbiE